MIWFSKTKKSGGSKTKRTRAKSAQKQPLQKKLLVEKKNTSVKYTNDRGKQTMTTTMMMTTSNTTTTMGTMRRGTKFVPSSFSRANKKTTSSSVKMMMMMMIVKSTTASSTSSLRRRRRGGRASSSSSSSVIVFSAVASASSSKKKKNVLVIGSGGREHALIYRLLQSETCEKVFALPGNAGIATEPTVTSIADVSESNHADVVKFCKSNAIDLVVVGPEAPLVDGLADSLRAENINVFGPSKKAAQLEGSKEFMKNLCRKYNIPTATYEVFSDAEKAKEYVRTVTGAPIVIKTSGLAAGKGVIMAETVEEAEKAIDELMLNKQFGDAGDTIVIEETLFGEEASFFAVVGGDVAVPLASAQDHKRVGDGDTGLNTGGMGAYSPAPVVTKEIEEDVMKNIIEPTVRGMREEGCEYNGVIFAGLMIDEKTKKVKLLEHNVRFGDPECQTLMARMESDLCQLLYAAATNNITDDDVKSVKWSKEPAVNVVLAAKGYPGSYSKGDEIKNLQGAEESTAKTKIFHAGTASGENGEILANGGRVLGITAMGTSVKEATKNAYVAIDKIDWPNGFCRSDIAYRAIEREEGRGK